jgi:hypothetical protein
MAPFPQAIDDFIHQAKHRELLKHGLDNAQQKALCDVREWLQILHSVQELVSAEKTPTLSVVLPLYERLIGMYAQEKCQNLSQDCTCNFVLR